MITQLRHVGYSKNVAYRPMTNFDRAVSAYIRATAAAKRLSAEGIAERAGVPYGSFVRYWRGERSIVLSDFPAIMDALGVTPEEATEEIWRIFNRRKNAQ